MAGFVQQARPIALVAVSALRRDSTMSVMTGLVSQLLLIPSGILAARLLGPEDRGHLAVLILIPSVTAIVAGLGLQLAVPYYIARDPESAGTLMRRLVKPITGQLVLVGVMQAIVLWALYRADERVLPAAVVSWALGPTVVLTHYAVGILQGRRRFRYFNLARVLPIALNSAFLITVLLLGRRSLEWVVWAQVASSILAAAVALRLAVGELRFATRLGTIPSGRVMLNYGARTLFGSVSPVETFRIDQVLVAAVLTPFALGIYVVALAFTNLPRFLAQSIGMVALPDVASQPAGRVRQTVTRYFWLASAVALLGVVALEAPIGFLVPTLFGNAFVDAIPIARLLLIAALFQSSRRALADSLRGAGLPLAGSIGELCSILVLVPGIIVLGPILGLTGIAISSIASAVAGLIAIAGYAIPRLRRLEADRRADSWT